MNDGRHTHIHTTARIKTTNKGRKTFSQGNNNIIKIMCLCLLSCPYQANACSREKGNVCAEWNSSSSNNSSSMEQTSVM